MMNKLLRMFLDNRVFSWCVTSRLRRAKELSDICTKYTGACPRYKLGLPSCPFKDNTCKISVTDWYSQLKKMGM